ncbi:MAG: acylphosphatase [Candidatus Hydrothermarchaeales archaeon]
MKARAHVFVSGRVQGVFYRAFAREKATSHGVRGGVRNLPDGRVEAILEGERKDIEEVIEELKVGPPYARVDEVEVEFEEYRNEFRDFQVRYF